MAICRTGIDNSDRKIHENELRALDWLYIARAAQASILFNRKNNLEYVSELVADVKNKQKIKRYGKR